MTFPPDQPRMSQQSPGGPGSSRGGLFPFPYRSWTTRGGSQVSVGGCCLPLPIGCLTMVGAVSLAAAKVASRRS